MISQVISLAAVCKATWKIKNIFNFPTQTTPTKQSSGPGIIFDNTCSHPFKVKDTKTIDTCQANIFLLWLSIPPETTQTLTCQNYSEYKWKHEIL